VLLHTSRLLDSLRLAVQALTTVNRLLLRNVWATYLGPFKFGMRFAIKFDEARDFFIFLKKIVFKNILN
jgi:hypothetical protein